MVLATLRDQFYIYLMILFISLVIAVLLNVARTEQDSIRFFSEYDAMTGALNRRAGLAIFNKRYIASPDRRCHVSICFVDINGLKEVNDNLGHEVGDELISTVAGMIKGGIRENDMFVRLGGDEFLIVFEGLDEDACETVWRRIVDGFDTINRTENRPYLISASHGIEAFHCNANQLVDSAINRADEKMYMEKRILKKELHVIRSRLDQPATGAGSVAESPTTAEDAAE
jgi:diguanylate cyclase (GGDEF)-like protein